MARKRTFGERMGVDVPPSLKRDELSVSFKTSIWNLCQWMFEDGVYHRVMRELYREMRWPIDAIPWHPTDGRKHLHQQLLRADILWTKFYQFAEFIPALFAIAAHPSASSYDQRERFKQARKSLNDVLEQEGSSFRMADHELVEITSEEELSELRQAASGVPYQFQPAADHIAQALAHLARRPQPNYHDTIKQAFSAVEAALWIAIGDKPKIPEAVREFEKKYGALHPALAQQIHKLHGYASDEEGIRHAATGPAEVGEAEARLMLVSCSAMLNFLIRKALRV
jgi:hypothetical protein